MFLKIKLWISNNESKLKITTFILLSFILLIITWMIDYKYIAIKQHIPKLLLLPVEVSTMFLFGKKCKM